MRIKAYAKINFTLDILGRLENSYHELDTVMQSVSIYDDLYIEKADGIHLQCNTPVLDTADNTTITAAENFFKYCDIKGGCRMELIKNIPVCAGMGGGSADAAAVIFALDKLYGTSLSDGELIKIAKSVGADVPFCIKGGTCRVGGIGEKIERLPDIPEMYFTVIKIGEKQSTGQMFRKIDLYPTLPPHTEKAVSCIKRGDTAEFLKYISNAFESICDTDISRQLLSAFSPDAICLSGSGPCVYAVFGDKESAKLCTDTLKRDGINANFAKSMPYSLEIV